MKQLLTLALAFLSTSFCHAQIKVDSNYTILAKGAEGKTNVIPFLLGDPGSLIIKENAGGKICSPTSLQYTFIIQSESFHAKNFTDTKKYLDRLKPKDRIIIDGLVLPANCFPPPEEIVIIVY